MGLERCGIFLSYFQGTKRLIRILLSSDEQIKRSRQRKTAELVNRQGVIPHQNNTTPHTFLATRQKLHRHTKKTMSLIFERDTYVPM